MNKNKLMKILLLVLVSFLLISITSFSCTTILIGKELTVDGSVIHAHNEDMGFTAVGRLWPIKSSSHKAGETLKVSYVSIPQIEQTFQYWASGNALSTTGLGISTEKRPYDAVLVGMNQWGVTMSCNWMYSKEENLPGEGIRRYALRQLILERAKTAKDAVLLVGEFIDKYGQADWGGLDYCLADPNEAWVIETTSKHWAAKKVKDDEILVVANYFVIKDDFDLSSKGLIEYAESKGWYDSKKGKFSFRDVYGLAERMNNPYDVERENRAYKLLESKKGVIVPEDLFIVLMDRYEGTTKYHKPLTIEHWEDVTDKLLIPRTINTNLCQSSSVAQLRSSLPVEIGAVMWYAMATPGYSGYFPVYAGAYDIPKEFQNVNSSISPDSAWWTFRLIQKYGDTTFNTVYPMLKSFWLTYHANILIRQNMIEEKAMKLIQDNKKEKAIKIINSFTFSEAQNMLQQARFQLRHIQDITGNVSIW